MRLIAVAIAVAALAGLGARLAGFSPVKITSGSMAPTVKQGGWVIIRGDHSPQRGDIVMFRFPLGTSGRAIKRVVAVAGDRVSYTDHTITVNGVTRSIGGAPHPGLTGSLEVPRGAVFLLGDHAEVSIDSRSFGVLPVGQAVGRVVTVLPV